MKTVVWDVDDTLNDLMFLWLRNRNFTGRRTPQFSELTENPPHRALGITLLDYQSSYDRFRLSDKYAKMPPSRAAQAWFRRNGARFRHIALTAVPLLAAHKSAAWVFQNFGRWIRTFHVVPSPRPLPKAPRYDVDKAAFIRSIGGCDYFVDDSPANIDPVRQTGARCLLVPRPWNSATGDMSSLLREIK